MTVFQKRSGFDVSVAEGMAVTDDPRRGSGGSLGRLGLNVTVQACVSTCSPASTDESHRRGPYDTARKGVRYVLRQERRLGNCPEGEVAPRHTMWWTTGWNASSEKTGSMQCQTTWVTTTSSSYSASDLSCSPSMVETSDLFPNAEAGADPGQWMVAHQT